MNTIFAAGLFDSPWVIAALVIGSALVNWLSKRRQEKQARNQPESEASSPAANKPPAEFDLEDMIRRLTGEKLPPPTAPPLIPRPPEEWTRMNRAEEARATIRQPARLAAPVLRPPVVVAPVSGLFRMVDNEVEQAERRFEQLNAQGRHPATVVSHPRSRPSRSGPRVATRWRDARSVRQAFVASLVFGPPKCSEP